ncbi:hypothetical protein N0V88_004085 [Collariella sp. IMI 366227]|nr:hypothetical protein N0V88_004085 [Collariella sp. IMI 366227]
MATCRRRAALAPPDPRGEQTAAAMESNLSSLENKLDQILASLGVTMEELDEMEEQEEQKEDGAGKSGKKGGA